MSLNRTNLEKLAYAFLEDHAVTNPDRKTIAHHVQCLADRIEQECAEYLGAAILDAANEPSDDTKYLGSMAYYRTSSLL